MDAIEITYNGNSDIEVPDNFIHLFGFKEIYGYFDPTYLNGRYSNFFHLLEDRSGTNRLVLVSEVIASNGDKPENYFHVMDYHQIPTSDVQLKELLKIYDRRQKEIATTAILVLNRDQEKRSLLVESLLYRASIMLSGYPNSSLSELRKFTDEELVGAMTTNHDPEKMARITPAKILQFTQRYDAPRMGIVIDLVNE
jgi:hypothetical protein